MVVGGQGFKVSSSLRLYDEQFNEEIGTSFQDNFLDESVLTVFQRCQSRNEFYKSFCVLFGRSMHVGKISEEEG